MEPTEKQQKRSLANKLAHFPKTHMVAAGSLTACLGLLFAMFPSEDVSAKRQAIPVALSVMPSEPLFPEEEIFEPLVEEIEWKTLTVANGDSLSVLFNKAGLNDRDVYEFTNSNKEAKSLRKIFPGHKLAFQIDDSGKLQQLHHIKSKLNSQLYKRTEAGFVFQDASKEPDIKLAYREATINNSLILAAQGVAMKDSLTIELANMFGWDIDFALDIRKGDHFKILFEEKFLDGEKLGHGEILAAEFTNRGTTYSAVRYTDENGDSNYFTPEGHSMRKEFLRAPLDFRRISSSFNPRRLHPIHKTVRPNNGTDYAADRGTPVWAAGDGRVVKAGYNSANGNYVFIEHPNGVTTKYLHLDKKKVKRGDRVKQKQTIGTVGSTGSATGNHLHYEFLWNGVHRNPATIAKKLPKAKAINKNELERFKQQIAPVVAQLNQRHQATQLALSSSSTSLN